MLNVKYPALISFHLPLFKLASCERNIDISSLM